jgi:hypothetical protein
MLRRNNFNQLTSRDPYRTFARRFRKEAGRQVWWLISFTQRNAFDLKLSIMSGSDAHTLRQKAFAQNRR